MQTLADAMKAKKDATGETFDDLALRFGVRQPTVSRWANGKAVPQNDKLPAIADWLGLSYDKVVAMAHRPPGLPPVPDDATPERPSSRIVDRDYNSDIDQLPPDAREFIDLYIDNEIRKQQG